AVADDDLLADVETEAHARRVARGAVRRSVEETEDRVELFLRDTDPFVGDGDAHAAVVLRTNVDRDRATTRRVLDRVRQEVVQHLFQVVAIGGHDAGGVASDRGRVRRGRELHPRRDLVRELPYVYLSVPDFGAAG